MSDPNDNYSGLFRFHSGPADSQATITKVLSSGEADGVFDAINDCWNDSSIIVGRERQDQLLGRIGGTLQALDFNRIGTSYFRGLLYTEGNLVADNDLIIEGSLVGAGANSDILLSDVKLVYVPELGRRAGETLGQMGVRTWIRR